MPKKKTQNTKKISGSASSQKRNDDNAEIIRDIQQIPHLFASGLKRALAWLQAALLAIPKWLKSIPRWLISRPQAVRAWARDGRKKKKYRTFRLQKKLKPEPRYVPSAHLLLWQSCKFLLRHYRVFLTIAIIHVLVYFVILKTPQNTLNINEIRESVGNALGKGKEGSWQGTLATLGTVIGLSGTSQENGTKIAVATLLVSLVYIWAIRQAVNKNSFNARDAYYQGLSPLFPAVLVLVIAAIQMLPFAVAGFVYSVARTGGLFVTGFEDMAFFSIALLFGLLSGYLLTPTVIAFYISTLPGMYPMRAFQSAKKLVQFQRLSVFRRLIALPLILGISYIALLLLMIRFVPSVTLYFTEWIQFAIIPLVHVYLYKLYRALI